MKTKDLVLTLKAVRKRLSLKKIVIGTIALIMFFAARNIMVGRSTIEAQTTTVKVDTIMQSVSSSGSVSADRLAYVGFPASGKVSWIGVSEGDHVRRGQALISLDKTLLNAAYQQASQDLRYAEASLDTVYDNVKNHDNDESFTQKELRTQAEVYKNKAYDAVIAARYNLSNSTLYAPFGGVVTSFSPGLVVGIFTIPASTVMTVVDPSTTYFEAEVGEVDITKLFIGQKAEIILDAFPEETIETTVKTIDFSSIRTSTGGTAYKVKLALPANISNKFRLGMNGDVEFILEKKENILLVTSTAIIEEDDSSYVWIVENGVSKKQNVETGISSTMDTQITSGLDEGDTVIVRPPSQISEGKKVKELN